MIVLPQRFLPCLLITHPSKCNGEEDDILVLGKAKKWFLARFTLSCMTSPTKRFPDSPNTQHSQKTNKQKLTIPSLWPQTYDVRVD